MVTEKNKRLAHGLAEILLSYAAHGMATRSLDGMGEITLRDGLIVAAAANAAAEKRAWIIKREVLPDAWSDSAVDLMISRLGNGGTTHLVGGVELKWWRQEDKGNASNRRQALVRDFIRAGSLYMMTEEFSFVALLSTAGSWENTASTSGSDREIMQRLTASGSQQWNLERDRASAAIRNAVGDLNGKLPVPNIIRSELLVDRDLRDNGSMQAFARVWAVKKPQRTRILSTVEMNAVINRT